MVSSSSSSSSSPSRRVKPAMSILTSSPSKKSRRGSVQISPLQPSAIANGASVPSLNTESKVPSTKVSSGANHTRKKTESISISHRVASNTPIPGKKQSNVGAVGASSLEYGYHSLRFTESNVAGRSENHGIQRCVAVLGSDVVLPPAVSQKTELDSAVARAPSPAEKQREPYIVRAVEGGGMGMFAQTFIPQGGVILVERPAVILPADAKLDALLAGFDGLEPRHRPFEALFARLDDQVKKEIYALNDCLAIGDHGRTPAGIFHTNALDIELETSSREGRNHRALFTKTSRCNHSCGPNAIWRFDLHTFTLTLSAVRRISPNEEITISYINNPFLPRHLRRAQLQSRWNFICHCRHCDVPWTSPGALTQSDKARMELCSFFDTVLDWEDWCLDENLKTGYDEHDLIGMHFRAMQLREMEGLQGFMGGVGVSVTKDVTAYMKHIDALVMCYGALADVQGFRMWVGKAREVKVAEGCPESTAHVKVLDRWLRDPRKFHVWGWKGNRD